MGMNFLSREEAEPILKPFLKPIFMCIQNAWDDFLGLDPGKIQPLEKRTRASMIRDYAVDHIKRLSMRYEEMIFGPKEGHLLISHRILLQVKKLTDGLAVSNYQTARRKKFDAQVPLEGVPEATRLTAGYVPDELWTKPRELYVVCHCGKIQEWHLRVNLKDNIQQQVEFLRLPLDDATPKKSRIRRKEDVLKIGVKKNE